MSWSIQGLHNNYLEITLERKETPSDYWRASDMGGCMRKRFYSRKGIPKTEPFTAKQKRVLDLGSMVHRYYQSLFKKLGILIEEEGEIINEKYHFKGHFDVLAGGKIQEINIDNFRYTDKSGEKKILTWLYDACVQIRKGLLETFPDGMPKLMYEMKTQDGNSFRYVEEKPNEEHVYQLASYLLFIRDKYPDVQEGRILYIDKNKLNEVEHIVRITPELENRIINELVQLNDYWQRNETPPQISEFGERGTVNWKCTYCPYLTFCRGKNWEKELKIKKHENTKKTR